MPTYVTLYKLTEQGIKDIKDAPRRIEEGIRAWEGLGGKLVAFYATQGEYDYVAISEAPSEEVATAFVLGQGAKGNVRTTSMRAFSAEEFAAIVGLIP
jgi:uncharacterized protein with GYD domain